MQPVILCGDSGTRLWPLSREHHPKPLHALEIIEVQSGNTLAKTTSSGSMTPTGARERCPTFFRTPSAR
jgi:mannose-1-phosphate guanylyltransferase